MVALYLILATVCFPVEQVCYQLISDPIGPKEVCEMRANQWGEFMRARGFMVLHVCVEQEGTDA